MRVFGGEGRSEGWVGVVEGVSELGCKGGKDRVGRNASDDQAVK